MAERYPRSGAFCAVTDARKRLPVCNDIVQRLLSGISHSFVFGNVQETEGRGVLTVESDMVLLIVHRLDRAGV